MYILSVIQKYDVLNSARFYYYIFVKLCSKKVNKEDLLTRLNSLFLTYIIYLYINTRLYHLKKKDLNVLLNTSICECISIIMTDL